MSKNKKYKISFYNMFIHKNDGIAIYNTKNGNFIRSFGKNALIVKKILSCDNIEVLNPEETEIERQLYEKGFLVDMGYDEIADQEKREKDGVFDEYLRLIILPTEACNFRCIYCYEHFLRGRMSKEVQDSIIKFVEREIDSYKGLIVSWFGGEPLNAVDVIQSLSVEFMQICKNHRKSYLAGMSTNGYDLTVDNLLFLKKLHITEYQITLDGLQEIHDKQRVLVDGKGTFNKIVTNLLSIKSSVSSPVFTFNIRTNFSKQMLPYIEEFYRFLNLNFMDDNRFTFFWQFASNYGFVRDESINDIFLSVNDFDILYQKYVKLIKNDYVTFLYRPSGSVCYALKRNAFVISSDGIFKKCTCDMETIENNFGKVENGIDINKHDKWMHCRDITEDSKCYKCIKRPICHNMACYKAKNCAIHLDKMEMILDWLSEDSRNYTVV